MAARTVVWFLAFGVAAPAAVLAGNLYWNWGGVVVTVLCILWIGFALALAQPPED